MTFYQVDLLVHTNFQTTISVHLFCCFQKFFNAFEYMGDWKKINEISLREKKDFCSHLNMEYITEADYRHAKRACKDFEITDLGKYHGL